MTNGSETDLLIGHCLLRRLRCGLSVTKGLRLQI
jgi:hypothetical protein